MAETNNEAQPDVNQTQAGMVVSPGGTTMPPPSAPQPVIGSEPEEATPGPSADVPILTDGDGVSWTASEFIAHQKSPAWYGGLVAVALVLTVVIFAITRDIISVIVIFLGMGAFWYYAGRQPRQLQYQLDSQGVMIGQKRYSYDSFRSFAVVPEGAFSTIVFMPLKRFAPLITIYYAPENEDQIINVLSPHLPLEEYRHDAIDRLMHRIRF
jgi:hypothetical protein